MDWLRLFIYIVVLLLSEALKPKPDEPRPAALGDLRVPTNDPTRAWQVIFGTVWDEAPNTVWYGHLKAKPIEKDGGWFSSDITVGWKYHLGVHSALGYTVDEIQEIRFRERTAWTGNATGGQIQIDKPGLFGDEDSDGGVGGKIDILMGGPTQPVNDYLLKVLGPNIPAFRGGLSVVYRRFYFGNSKNLPFPSFKLKRTDIQTDFSPQWYPAKADINSDLNGAHILREVITNYDWGMQYPPGQADDISFTATADTLYAEGLGLSLKWTSSTSIDQFIKIVEDHIGGALDVDPTTGLFTLNLIRDDYTPSELLLLDESNSQLGKFDRRGWGETVNQVTVIYRDRETNQDLPAPPVQDSGNIQIQGAVVAETISLTGLSNPTLAGRAANSLLRSKTAPLSSIELHDVSRVAYQLQRGQVFRYSNARLGLSEIVYRVAEIKRGNLTDGGITITAVEDVFSLDTNTYVEQQASGWVSPNTEPVPAPYEQVIEASYWDVQKGMSAAELAALGADFGFLLAHAVRPAEDAYKYRIHSRKGADPYQKHGVGLFCPTAELDGALPVDGAALTNRVVALKNGIDLDEVQPGRFAYIDDECVAVLSIDTTLLTITIDHGVLDTVPVDHPDSARIWFAEGRQGIDATTWADTDSVDAKILPETTLGALDISAATALPLTIANRYERPYPPGNFKINGVPYPGGSLEGNTTISWSHRDRSQQLDALHTQAAGDIGPEVGTTYRVEFDAVPVQDNWLVEDVGGANSYLLDVSVNEPPIGTETLVIRVISRRDGLDAWQYPQTALNTKNAPVIQQISYAPLTAPSILLIELT